MMTRYYTVVWSTNHLLVVSRCGYNIAGLAPPSLVSGGMVVLFSNDTQLCSKAIVNGIKAFNSKVMM